MYVSSVSGSHWQKRGTQAHREGDRAPPPSQRPVWWSLALLPGLLRIKCPLVEPRSYACASTCVMGIAVHHICRSWEVWFCEDDREQTWMEKLLLDRVAWNTTKKMRVNGLLCGHMSKQKSDCLLFCVPHKSLIAKHRSIDTTALAHTHCVRTSEVTCSATRVALPSGTPIANREARCAHEWVIE